MAVARSQSFKPAESDLSSHLVQVVDMARDTGQVRPEALAVMSHCAHAQARAREGCVPPPQSYRSLVGIYFLLRMDASCVKLLVSCGLCRVLLEKLSSKTVAWRGDGGREDKLACDETTNQYRTACLCIDIAQYLASIGGAAFKELETREFLGIILSLVQRTGKPCKVTEKATKLVQSVLEAMDGWEQSGGVTDSQKFIDSLGRVAFARFASVVPSAIPVSCSPAAVYRAACRGRLNLALLSLLQSVVEGYPERAGVLVARGNPDLAEFACKQFSYAHFTADEFEAISWCLSAIVEDSRERSDVFASFNLGQCVLYALASHERMAKSALFACCNFLSYYLELQAENQSPALGAKRVLLNIVVHLQNLGSAIPPDKLYNVAVVAMKLLSQTGTLTGQMYDSGMCSGVVTALRSCASFCALARADDDETTSSSSHRNDSGDILSDLLMLLCTVAETSPLSSMLVIKGGVFDLLVKLLAERTSTTVLPEFSQSFLAGKERLPYSGVSLNVDVSAMTGHDQRIMCAATRVISSLMEHEVFIDLATENGGEKKSLELGKYATEASLRLGLWHVLVNSLDNAVHACVDHGMGAWQVVSGTLINIVGIVGYMLREQAAKIAEVYSTAFLQRSCSVLVRLLGLVNTRRLVVSPNDDAAAIKVIHSICSNCCGALTYFVPLLDNKAREQLVRERGIDTLVSVMLESPPQQIREENDADEKVSYEAAQCLLELLGTQSFDAGRTPMLHRLKQLDTDTRLDLLAFLSRVRIIDKATLSKSSTDTVKVPCIEIDASDVYRSSLRALDAIGLHATDADIILWNEIRVKFTSLHGETGVDEGGLRRDWITRLSSHLLDATNGYTIHGFVPSDSIQLSPATLTDETCQGYRLIGCLIGLCLLFQDSCLGVRFVPSVCKQLLGIEPNFADLKHISEQYYITLRNLMEARRASPVRFAASLQDLTFVTKSREAILKELSESNLASSSSSADEPANAAPPRCAESAKKRKKGLIRTLSQATQALNEATASRDREAIRELMILRSKLYTSGGASSKRSREEDQNANESEPEKKRARRLMRGVSNVEERGSEKTVNEENFDQFIEKLCEKLMTVNVGQQLFFVRQGLHCIIPSFLLKTLVAPDELAPLLEGEHEISVASWKENTEYLESSTDFSLQVEWFWDYASRMSNEKRRSLLQWCTGWRSVSRKGFGVFKFKIQIVPADTEDERARLPTASTCGFHISMPAYESREQLEDKFNYALKEAMGFGAL